jgi:LDH2 family malate/lactate/ureidoglycolate dehydrogenase
VAAQPSSGATAVPAVPGSTVSIDALNRFCSDALISAGMSADDAAIGAHVLSMTDGWGVFTHGSKALRGYVRRLYAGGLNPHGRPAIAAEGGAWAVVDGDSSLGMVTSSFAMKTAIEKARASGIGYVGVRNSCHFGAAGYYAWLAADAGFIGMSMANDIPSVAAPGSRGAITGSNPLAYAVPAGRYKPMLLDMSVATVAGGKVYAARERGESIPSTWLIGPDGLPTDDPTTYPESSTLAPAAGHKGYGIALLIETLAALLSGAASTWGVRSWLGDDPTLPTGHGAAFLAIDCATIAGEASFVARVEQLIDEIHQAPTAEGAARIYVPGEIEWEKHAAAMRDGIRLPSDVIASVTEAAEICGLELDSYFFETSDRS